MDADIREPNYTLEARHIAAKGQIFACSAFDGSITLGESVRTGQYILPVLMLKGREKCLTTYKYTDHTISHRPLSSDPLAVHQTGPDIIFAGMRSAEVQLHDTRIHPAGRVIVGRTRMGKAVVGVKRLQDSAVPWGLLVSGMGNEVRDSRLDSVLQNTNGADGRCFSLIRGSVPGPYTI